MTSAPACSFIGEGGECQQRATWTVYRDDEQDPYDYTQACDEHLVTMLDPDAVNIVAWIDPEDYR